MPAFDSMTGGQRPPRSLFRPAKGETEHDDQNTGAWIRPADSIGRPQRDAFRASSASRRRPTEQTTTETADLSWRQAEHAARTHMITMGFKDAALTPTGADGGLDVVASRAAAQVKNHAAPVGAPGVQQLRGAAHGHAHCLFYSRSGYTPAALKYADQAGVCLFSFSGAGTVTPANGRAQVLARQVGRSDSGSVSMTAKQQADETALSTRAMACREEIRRLRRRVDSRLKAPKPRREVKKAARALTEADRLVTKALEGVGRSKFWRGISLTTAEDQIKSARKFLDAR